MSMDNDQPITNRRQFLKSGALAGAAGLAFSSLALAAHQPRGSEHSRRVRSADYGPLYPTADLITGLNLLALPKEFRYMSFGWTGQIMDDGRPTPTDHDGMAVCGKHGHIISLVRNHELSAGEGSQCLVPGRMYNTNEYGGTTNLYFDLHKERFVRSYTSLGGTIRNCAGGPTPWDSWVSCEETFHSWGNRADGYNHGYVFDVPAFGHSNGQPIRAAGRFSHEAVAVDPRTGVMYETEDAGSSAFYKYVQPGAGKPNWRARRHRNGTLEDGGELYALVIRGAPAMDMRGGFNAGDTFDVSWQPVGDPEGITGRALDSAPKAAIFSRGEGCWEDSGLIFFVSTDGGASELGQVWVLDPRQDKLTMLYESSDATAVDGPDNIAISPRGGIVLCEDGGSNPKRLIGLSIAGEIFPLAENRIELVAGDIDILERAFPGTKANFWDNAEGNYTGQEWAGATFYRDWLFANVQSPGVTFAITGPWRSGAL